MTIVKRAPKNWQMIFTVNRRRWLRGEGSSASKLFRLSDQKMCCIGFCGLKLGVSKVAMMDQPGLHRVNHAAAEKLAGWSMGFLGRAHTINDNPNISDREREWQLNELMGERGHGFKFVN